MGNICRSPAAECVMKNIVATEGLQDRIICDSAGTISFHTGNPPDSRMRNAAANRKINMTGAARQIRHEDFKNFDLILAMDDENFTNIAKLNRTDDSANEVKRFCEFVANHSNAEVPDPYYGGESGFELVLDLIEDGCQNILKYAVDKLRC